MRTLFTLSAGMMLSAVTFGCGSQQAVVRGDGVHALGVASAGGTSPPAQRVGISPPPAVNRTPGQVSKSNPNAPMIAVRNSSHKALGLICVDYLLDDGSQANSSCNWSISPGSTIALGLSSGEVLSANGIHLLVTSADGSFNLYGKAAQKDIDSHGYWTLEVDDSRLKFEATQAAAEKFMPITEAPSLPPPPIESTRSGADSTETPSTTSHDGDVSRRDVLPARPVVTTAKLRFNRNKAWTGKWRSEYVSINGVKVGSVENGDSEDFTFVPSPGGENQVAVRGSEASFEPSSASFHADPGGLVIVDADVQLGWMANTVKLTVNEDQACVRVGHVTMDPHWLERERSSEIVTTPVGVVQKFHRYAHFQRSVSVTREAVGRLGFSASLAKSLEETIGVSISGELSASLDYKKMSTASSDELFERFVTIDGRTPRVKITWVEKYRTGRAEVRLNDLEDELPFEVPCDMELRVEDVK